MTDAAPPCRVCGKSEPVLCYDPADNSTAICPTCREKAEHPNGETGHEWQYDRYEHADACGNCGIFRRDTNYESEGPES